MNFNKLSSEAEEQEWRERKRDAHCFFLNIFTICESTTQPKPHHTTKGSLCHDQQSSVQSKNRYVIGQNKSLSGLGGVCEMSI